MAELVFSQFKAAFRNVSKDGDVIAEEGFLQLNHAFRKMHLGNLQTRSPGRILDGTRLPS